MLWYGSKIETYYKSKLNKQVNKSCKYEFKVNS